MKWFANLRTLLIAMWLGAALFFSFAVAPSAFAILSSREAAGAVVSRTLAIVNYSGLIVGLILLASSFILSRRDILIWAERISLAVLAIACAVGQFVIGARLHNLREQTGRPIEELAIDAPLRVEFNNLHAISVWVLIIGMIAALVSYFLIARGLEKN